MLLYFIPLQPLPLPLPLQLPLPLPLLPSSPPRPVAPLHTLRRLVVLLTAMDPPEDVGVGPMDVYRVSLCLPPPYLCISQGGLTDRHRRSIHLEEAEREQYPETAEEHTQIARESHDSEVK